MSSERPPGWRATRLGDECDLLAGFAFKSRDFTGDPSDVRLLRGDNVAQGYLRWLNARRLPSGHPDAVPRYALRRGDVILAMDRPWIEAGLKWAVVRVDDLPSLLVQRVLRLRATGRLDQGFLAALIAHPQFTAYIRQVQTGTAVPHISARQVSAYRFALPPLREQRAIASLLDALDAKIESNRRVGGLLENMESALFKRLVASRTEDWSDHVLSDVAEINARSHSAKRAPAVVDYIDISSVSPRRVDAITTLPFGDAPSRARRVVRDGDTLISTVRPERRAMAFIHQASPNLTASTGFAVLSPTLASPTYLYRLATSDECIDRLSAAATGSAYPAVNAKVLAEWSVPMPPDFGAGFEAVARPMHAYTAGLRAENRRLAHVRDALLPKLITGQLRVPDSANGPMELVAMPPDVAE